MNAPAKLPTTAPTITTASIFSSSCLDVSNRHAVLWRRDFHRRRLSLLYRNLKRGCRVRGKNRLLRESRGKGGRWDNYGEIDAVRVQAVSPLRFHITGRNMSRQPPLAISI